MSIEELLEVYTNEACDFTDRDYVIQCAELYMYKMEDCHLKCILYSLIEELKKVD